MDKMIFFIAAAVCVPFCSSQEINCAVDVTSSGTRYRIPESTDLNCSYHWTNGTRLVLATKDGKLETVVVSSNATEMVTYECHEVINYEQCRTSAKKRRTAVCKTTCPAGGDEEAKGSLLKTLDVNNTILNTTNCNTTTSNNNTIIIGTVLGFLLIIVVLCFIYRGKLCKRMKERRPAVNGNIQPANGDVERGKLLEPGPVASPSQANGEIQTCGEQANSTQEDSHETGELNQEPSCSEAAV